MVHDPYLPQGPCVGLFHISDLHFVPEGKGQPQWVGGRRKEGRMIDVIRGDDTDEFLNRIPRLLEERQDEGLPKPAAIIVNGDLVEKGRDRQPREIDQAFSNAAQFLRKLAEALGIADLKRVFVVPGNHDVDWTASEDPAAKFARYLESVQPFSTPRFDADSGEADPLLVELSDLDPRVDGQLLFLISPTLGGLRPEEAEALESRFAELLAGKLPEEQIAAVVNSVIRSLDVAAIGSAQRTRMQRLIDNSRGGRRAAALTRVAILHHHLLPDDVPEIKEFEAVIDAGRVLSDLVSNGFDLALTGHKHNRRMLHFRQSKAEGMDVFCAPVLFPNHGGTPGFTLLDLYGSGSAIYAVLDYRRSRDFSREKDPPVPLWRNHLAFGDLARELWPIQAEHYPCLVPTMHSIRKAFAWRGHPRASKIFDRAWDQVHASAKTLADRCLALSDPGLNYKWQEILDLLAPEDELRVVSLDDLRYWVEAMQPRSALTSYTDPLRRFSGKKSRVLILPKRKLRARRADVRNVIRTMRAQGFCVSLVVKENLQDDSLCQDFGILGNFAVWSFSQRITAAARDLILNFHEAAVQAAELSWTRLQRSACWQTPPPGSRRPLKFPPFLRNGG